MGLTRPSMTQKVGRAQHGPTYNGFIYLGPAFSVAGHNILQVCSGNSVKQDMMRA